MKLIRGKYRVLVLTGLFILISLGLSLWFAPGPEQRDKPRDADESPWSPLALDNRKRSLNEALRTVTRGRPWGEEDAGSRGKARSGQWRFCGVVRSGENRFALIEEDKKVRRYTQGDTLPGGMILKTVGNDHIEVQTGDEIRVFKLYGPPQ